MAPNKIFIYGSGGHGKVIADIARSCGYTIAGWIDDRPLDHSYSWERFCLSHPSASIALGIGNNQIRETIYNKVSQAGYTLPALVHSSACVSPSALIAEGTVVMPLAIINADASIAHGCIINSASVIEHECSLGPFSHISPNAALAGNVHVGHHTHIGIGASIIQNITIGSGCIIAAGSAVIGDIPDTSLAAGVPAVIKKRLSKPF